MKRVVGIMCVSLVAAGLGMRALAQHAHAEGGQAKPVSIIGELIDTACFVTSDGDAKGPEHAACAKDCMGSGVPAAILPQGTKDASGMMFLLTNPIVLAPYAGQTIKVEGNAHPEMRAIDVQRLYVKDGNDWKEIQLKDAHHKMEEGAGHGGHGGHGDHK